MQPQDETNALPSSPLGELLLLCSNNEWVRCIGEGLKSWVVEQRDVNGLKPSDANQFDVIVIAFDNQIDLPVIREIRHQMPTAVVIVVSCGRPDGDDELTALRTGVDDFINIDEVKDEFLMHAIIQAKARRAWTINNPSDDNFLKLIMHNADGVMIVDESGIVRFLNPAAEQLLGVKAEEFTGEFFGFPYTSDFIELTIVPGALMGRAEPDSPVLMVEMRVTGITWEGSACHLVSLRDVTARHTIRMKMEHYAAELARSNKELELFAYSASHDLQEPLRMVYSFSSLLEEHYADVIDERGKTWLHFASDGARRMKRMVEDLLEYSRIDRQGQAFREQSLNRTLKKSLANLQQVLRDRRAVIVYDNLPIIKADHAQLARVFQNLLVNAIKHNDKEKPVVHIFAEPAGEGWSVSVCDNGPGIPEKQRERIFDLFQRGKSKSGGSGIGLAVCQRIITRHDGSMGVTRCQTGENARRCCLPGCDGARFWFFLPHNPAL